MESAVRLLKEHPEWPAASSILRTLRAAGYRALLAGGCVRDALLNVQAQDLDIATSATPEQVQKLFARTVAVGASFGVIRVRHDDREFEVATFRRDLPTQDHRHPQGVEWSDEKEDALRRDFTVNALFFDPDSGEILDYVGGVDDLRRKVLRTVGRAEIRFAEDHLRILRALRFSIQLDLTWDPETESQVHLDVGRLKSISPERIRDELYKMLKTGRGDRVTQVLKNFRVFHELWPELENVLPDHNPLLQAPPGDRAEAFARWLAPVAISRPEILPPMLRSLKLSSAEIRSLTMTFAILSEGDRFWKRPPGEKIFLFGKPEVARALRFDETLTGRPELVHLCRDFQKVAVDGVLPARLVRGTELSAFCQGRLLGEALDAVYFAQLEGVVTDTAQALTWVSEWLKMASR